MLGNNRLIGIVSYGSESCGTGVPAVYTNLENVEIRNWIKDNTGI